MRTRHGSLFSLFAVVVFLFLSGGCSSPRIVDTWSFQLELAKSEAHPGSHKITVKDDKCMNANKGSSGFSIDGFLLGSTEIQGSRKEKNCEFAPDRCCEVTIGYDGDYFNASSRDGNIKGKEHHVEVRGVKLSR